MQLEKLADMVVLTIKTTLAPVLERLALSEQSNKDLQARVLALTELRDRLTTVETKTATLAEPREPEPRVDLAPVLERVAASEARLSVLGDLRDRVVTVETKAALMPAVVPSVAFDAAPMLARLAALEATPTPVVETKDVDLSPMLDRVSALETKVGALTPLLDIPTSDPSLDAMVLTASVENLFRKELTVLDRAAPSQTTKRIMRDAHGRATHVIDEPVRA